MERLDNNKGYTKDNVVLETVEFNTTDYTPRNVANLVIKGSAQWNRMKVTQFYETYFGENILYKMPGYREWISLG